MSDVGYRAAGAGDIDPIALLHAESWRRTYRGAYADDYLDGPVFADRMAVWTDRLTDPRPDQITLVAERQGALAGFAHTFLDHDPIYGALLENLHVAPQAQRQGVASRLLAETAACLIDRRPSSSLYLTVLEHNESAQALYQARRGSRVGRAMWEPPGGGAVAVYTYVWRDVRSLLPAP